MADPALLNCNLNAGLVSITPYYGFRAPATICGIGTGISIAVSLQNPSTVPEIYSDLYFYPVTNHPRYGQPYFQNSGATPCGQPRKI